MLRKLRIILATLVLVCISLLFVGIGQEWWGWLAKLQFLPSCLALNFAVIASILAITILFGRIYCSVICPLGIYQDFVIWARRQIAKLLTKAQAKKFKKAKLKGSTEAFKPKAYAKRFSYSKEKKYLRYGMLILVLIAFVAGIQAFIALIAPYSAYGRILRGVVGLVEGQSMAPIFLVVAGISLVGISISAWLWGRAWCNIFCPVGTVLGLFSRFSLFRAVIDVDKCNSCGRCYKGCKSSCIDGKHHQIDYSRCIDCFDCIESCSGKAIKYRFVGFKHKKSARSEAQANSCVSDESRRAFLSTGLFALGALAANSASAKLAKTNHAASLNLIVPPGAGSVKNFYDKCTACQLCVSNCKGGVLRPSGDLNHFLQPHIDYSKGYCQTDCNSCSSLCPAGAISPISLSEKRQIRIGIAKVDEKTCVSCGKCARRCPEGAIEMFGGHAVVDTSKCIGCGACEYVCPVKPVKAIKVMGIDIHGKK